LQAEAARGAGCAIGNCDGGALIARRNRASLPAARHDPAPHEPEHEALLRRIERDLIDGFDEELELEIEGRELDGIDRPASSGDTDGDRFARQRCFRELFRLQGDLVKLQDGWRTRGTRW
jgi:hypothetical protein